MSERLVSTRLVICKRRCGLANCKDKIELECLQRREGRGCLETDDDSLHKKSKVGDL